MLSGIFGSKWALLGCQFFSCHFFLQLLPFPIPMVPRDSSKTFDFISVQKPDTPLIF
uniref:Uncharacterized protein n=1 Tax=Arundo donax TaxID=35708 RepID=A0A0A9FRV8_ARUDO